MTHLIRVALALLSLVHGLAWAQNSTPAQTPQQPVTWLFFVDDLHLDFRNTGRIRDLIKVMASELVQEGDRFAMVSSGPSNVNLALTTDRQALAAATRFATGSALRLEDMLRSRGGVSETLYRASTSLTAARTMLSAVRTEAAPIAMLYLSNGYSFELLEEPGPGSAPLIRGRSFTHANVREQLTDLTAAATQASVRIFTIDARAIINSSDLDSTYTGSPAHQLEMQRVLRSIADETGGFPIAEGDFRTQLRRMTGILR